MCITKTGNKKVVKHKDVYPILNLGILPNPEIVKKSTPGPKNYVFCQKLDHMTIICHRTCKTIRTHRSVLRCSPLVCDHATLPKITKKLAKCRLEVQESVPVLCVGPRPGNLNASWLRLVSGTRVMYWSVLGVVVQLRPPTPRVGKCFAGVGCRGYCL